MRTVGGINILMYHQVGEFARVANHRSTYCDHRRFATQMALLASGGYRVLSMDQALACLRGEAPISSRDVVLTFDDGYESFCRYVLPVLQRHGFPAMVYLIAGLLGRRAEWFARDGRETPMLLSAAEVRGLQREGIDFGSHSFSHLKLAHQDDATLRAEVGGSRRMLEDVLGAEVRHFCYPYGSHDLRTIDAVAQAGYATATTCMRAPARPGQDLLALPRKAISQGDNLRGFWWRLHVKNQPRRPLLARPCCGACV